MLPLRIFKAIMTLEIPPTNTAIPKSEVMPQIELEGHLTVLDRGPS